MRLTLISHFFTSLQHPWKFVFNVFRRVPHLIPDKLFLQVKYRAKKGIWPNLDNPQTFTEKINWLKLNDRNPIYTKMVDKYEVKSLVALRIGGKYIIPTLGIWERAELINWDSLPDQFVLKTTHGGGSNGVVVCTNKSKFNKEQAIAKLNKSLKSDIFLYFREWPYKNVPRRIIAETFMKDDNAPLGSSLSDYKFYCFNGEPMYCQVIRDRNTKETIDFYDMDWNHQEFVGLNPVARNGLSPVARPEKLEVMKDICKKLAKDIPFVRVDLYIINESIYFGELTFYPASGFGVFTPSEWDAKLGELLMI